MGPYFRNTKVREDSAEITGSLTIRNSDRGFQVGGNSSAEITGSLLVEGSGNIGIFVNRNSSIEIGDPADVTVRSTVYRFGLSALHAISDETSIVPPSLYSPGNSPVDPTVEPFGVISSTEIDAPSTEPVNEISYSTVPLVKSDAGTAFMNMSLMSTIGAAII